MKPEYGIIISTFGRSVANSVFGALVEWRNPREVDHHFEEFPSIFNYVWSLNIVILLTISWSHFRATSTAIFRGAPGSRGRSFIQEQKEREGLLSWMHYHEHITFPAWLNPHSLTLHSFSHTCHEQTLELHFYLENLLISEQSYSFCWALKLAFGNLVGRHEEKERQGIEIIPWEMDIQSATTIAIKSLLSASSGSKSKWFTSLSDETC